jgi:hypothetical protein
VHTEEAMEEGEGGRERGEDDAEASPDMNGGGTAGARGKSDGRRMGLRGGDAGFARARESGSSASAAALGPPCCPEPGGGRRQRQQTWHVSRSKESKPKS